MPIDFLVLFVGVAEAVQRLAHSRDTKTIPVVPRLVLVSYVSVTSIMLRLERYLKARQSIISQSCTFFEAPCSILDGKLN